MGNNRVNFCCQIATSPTGYNASGLSAGDCVNTTTGLIRGTPPATGTSSVSINASSGLPRYCMKPARVLRNLFLAANALHGASPP